MKASLQKALVVQKTKFKEQQKKAQAVQREIQKAQMKQEGGESHQNIILPKYVMNKELKVYEEIDVPPKSLYKVVGYNDMERVKIIMEGDDKDKRDGDKAAAIKTRSSLKSIKKTQS